MKVLMVCGNGSERRLQVGLDSAILRPGEPVFMADDAREWVSSLVPAVRICRLGTSIKAVNARLYYSEATIFHYAMPADGYADGIPALAMDRALSPGNWYPVCELDPVWHIQAIRKALNSDAVETYGTTIRTSALDIDGTIEWLSSRITFKQGDIILFGNNTAAMGHPELDTAVSASINGLPAINIRIK